VEICLYVKCGGTAGGKNHFEHQRLGELEGVIDIGVALAWGSHVSFPSPRGSLCSKITKEQIGLSKSSNTMRLSLMRALEDKYSSQRVSLQTDSCLAVMYCDRT
jgi:hypothetical protein